jgi:hypothetical protein
MSSDFDSELLLCHIGLMREIERSGLNCLGYVDMYPQYELYRV